MKTDELNYNLPEELIAQTPAEKRSNSRLMLVNRADNSFANKVFSDIVSHLNKDDCLVLNDTRVLPARFYARRKSGANLEGLFLSADADGWNIMLKNCRKVKSGEHIILLNRNLNEHTLAQTEQASNGIWRLKIKNSPEKLLNEIGFAPLPPYIKRKPNDNNADDDMKRYQTVYARDFGAVAAPTAGLHFTDELLSRIKAKGVKIAHVTLHVGAGTFKPVTAQNLADHDIHSERYQIDNSNAKIINEAKKSGARIIAVGTTSVRTLETVADDDGTVKPCSGDTKLFITPGYKYKIVDAMITNFHLPKSTLLALVGAFAGMDLMMRAYKYAVNEKYRFYSYGDAMLII